MIEITGFNNSIERIEYYVTLNKKTMSKINKSIDNINKLYESKNGLKLENKMTKINNEGKTLSDNNDKYVYVLKQTLDNYRHEMKNYGEKFETLENN